MVLCRSIMTTLYALESPSSLMETSARLSSIPLPRITSGGSTIHIPIFPESGVSSIPSMLSCRRLFNFFSSLLAVEMCLRRTRKFRKIRSSEAPFTVNTRRRISSRALLVPCGAIEVLSPCRSGKMSIQVCLWL